MKRIPYLLRFLSWIGLLLLPFGLFSQTTLAGGPISTNTTWTGLSDLHPLPFSLEQGRSVNWS